MKIVFLFITKLESELKLVDMTLSTFCQVMFVLPDRNNFYLIMYYIEDYSFLSAPKEMYRIEAR